MKKLKSITALPNLGKKERKSRKEDIFDQDSAWKTFIATDIFDCLAVVHPILYAAVDKTVEPVFLEQEMINSMRGKYKIIGKEKKTDKLVRLRLLNGEDFYVYVHLEVQDDLKDEFPERIYIYRSLISLRYMTQKITTIVIFTGKSPSEKHKVFKEECFNSTLLYSYTSYVIADQVEAKLEKMNNPFALAVLAAKYTINTEGDARRRLMFKQKVFELAQKKQFSVEKMEELLSFVFDYMLLSEDMENEFMAKTPIFLPLKSDTMVITRGKRALAEMASIAIYGKPFDEVIAEQKVEQDRILAEQKAEQDRILAKQKAEQAKLLAAKEAEQDRILAKQKAEQAKLLAAKEAEQDRILAKQKAEQAKLLAAKEAEQAKLLAAKEAEQATERRNTIISLLNINFTPEKIAEVLGYDLDYVLKVAANN